MERYYKRLRKFQHTYKGHNPRLRHYGWWLLHNVVAHPILGIIPCRLTFAFHDWTSSRLNNLPYRAFDDRFPTLGLYTGMKIHMKNQRRAGGKLSVTTIIHEQ